jgi:hypothetical protein
LAGALGDNARGEVELRRRAAGLVEVLLIESPGRHGLPTARRRRADHRGQLASINAW